MFIFLFFAFWMIFSVFQKIWVLGILGKPYCGICATIRIGQEMLCLPCGGFFLGVCTFRYWCFYRHRSRDSVSPGIFIHIDPFWPIMTIFLSHFDPFWQTCFLSNKFWNGSELSNSKVVHLIKILELSRMLEFLIYPDFEIPEFYRMWNVWNSLKCNFFY